MEKNIKDYLHLYLGCECLGNDGKPYTLKPSHFPSNWKEGINGHKPILRPLSDMTEEEFSECVLLHFGIENRDVVFGTINKIERYSEPKMLTNFGTALPYRCSKDGIHVMTGTLSTNSLNPQQFKYMLSKHFDLFGLIPDGLAIDKTTLK